MEYLKVKKWEEFQHYKKRNPPWIRLYRKTLDDRVFMALPDASRALAPCIWLLASESNDGKVPADVDWLAWRLRKSVSWIKRAIKPLIDNKFLEDASGVLAPCKQHATSTFKKVSSETDARLRGRGRSETETEKISEPQKVPLGQNGFDQWYSKYPKKQSKEDGRKAWKKLHPSKDLIETMIKAIEHQVEADHFRGFDGCIYIPTPGKWIRAGRWEDEINKPQTRDERIAELEEIERKMKQ